MRIYIYVFRCMKPQPVLEAMILQVLIVQAWTTLPWSNPTRSWSLRFLQMPTRGPRVDTITLFFHDFSVLHVCWRILMQTLMSKQIKSASKLLKLCLIFRYMRALKKGAIKVRTNDFPSFLYPQGGYDPDDLESRLLQNLIVVRVSFYIQSFVH